MAKEVIILRKFRDNVLMTNFAGKVFVELYYKIPPPIADYIANHDGLRFVLQVTLLPIVGISWALLKIGGISALAVIILLGCGYIGLAGAKRKFRK